MARLSRWSTVLILLIFLAGNLILPLVNHNCYLFLPTHDHIILGPVQPGWENHSHNDALDHSHRPGHISDDTDYLIQGKVISIAHPHTGFHSILNYGSQPLLLVGWLMPPELVWLNWPLDLTFVTPFEIFLSPPDKPPKLFTNLP